MSRIGEILGEPAAQEISMYMSLNRTECDDD